MLALMGNKIKKWQKDQRGQSLIEFTLVLVFVFIPLLFGIFEFGRIFGGNLVVSHAAREGARAGVVSLENERVNAVEAAVMNNAFFLDISDEDIDIQGAGGEPGDSLSVQVTYDMDLIVPDVLDVIPNPIELEGQAVMRIE